MSIFTPKRDKVWRLQFEKELKEHYGDNYTANNVLDYIIGTWDDTPEGKYVLVKRYCYEATHTKWWQRLNKLWVVPLYFVVVAPIKYIYTGETGVEKESEFGKVLVKLLGNY